MALDSVQAVRDIALAFPEATEKETWGHPTFRVRERIFVTCGLDDQGNDSIVCKASPSEQEALLAQGWPFFLPAYVGAKGWIGVILGPDTDWRQVGDLIADSYREVAPNELAAGIGLAPPGQSRAARAVLGVGNIIGELIEGKPPKDQQVAEDVADEDEPEDGFRVDFDPDDPSGTSIEL